MLQEWINPLRNYKLHLLIYVIYKFPPGRNSFASNKAPKVFWVSFNILTQLFLKCLFRCPDHTRQQISHLSVFYHS